ncbi:uncharacterized protein EV420DRAFT_1524994 [Desarmillaria tabescens]|uniref:Uncharacterized protein n=1 Tax=Armillaria tabescens TaxID=1929756 RepID=A0AA39NBB6_ARMTA|nr:uncharacterized protein EV420DRAFT_1524994 [Desarmillaria tabescens]KAK0462471.1 hypothetical protein EV420DRAFT_1524994 [Desarmillaria tabescens]
MKRCNFGLFTSLAPPSMLATATLPDSPSFSARFYVTSRDVASNYRHTTVTIIPTVPASLPQNASTICNPGISQQDSTRWTRSRAQERKTTLLESRTSGRVPDVALISLMEGPYRQRASKTAHFDSGSTDGASQRMFPSSGILTNSESDICISDDINTEEAHAMFSDSASPAPVTSSAPRLSPGLAQATTKDRARSHAQKLTVLLLKLGKAGQVPDEAELSLMKNRFGQRASQATRFNWGSTDGVPRHIGALRPLLTPPPSPMVVSPPMSISSLHCSPVQARDLTPAGDIGPYSTASSTSSMQPHPMLRPLALFPHAQHPDTQDPCCFVHQNLARSF